MSHHLFFCPELELETQTLELSAPESHHAATVLRLQTGDAVILMNGRGILADATLISVEKRRVLCQVTSACHHERGKRIRLYIAPPRNKNMETVIRCATELGVERITPVICQFGVSKPDSDKEGWRQTAVIACKQSRNPYLPQFDAPMEFAEAVTKAVEVTFLGAVPRPGDRACDVIPASEAGYALWIGPEGGFSDDETHALLEAGAIPMTVGPCILRVETAVPALLGALYARLTR